MYTHAEQYPSRCWITLEKIHLDYVAIIHGRKARVSSWERTNESHTFLSHRLLEHRGKVFDGYTARYEKRASNGARYTRIPVHVSATKVLLQLHLLHLFAISRGIFESRILYECLKFIRSVIVLKRSNFPNEKHLSQAKRDLRIDNWSTRLIFDVRDESSCEFTFVSYNQPRFHGLQFMQIIACRAARNGSSPQSNSFAFSSARSYFAGESHRRKPLGPRGTDYHERTRISAWAKIDLWPI